MRNLHALDGYRLKEFERKAYGAQGGAGEGAFLIPCHRTGVSLRVIASSGMGWDHVSVSLPNRCPNWLEMEHIKRHFFEPDEVAMQLHVKPADHINAHPYTLHLWRPQNAAIPLPPHVMVA